MTRNAGVRADIKIFQVAHAGRHAIRVRVVRPCVRANPILRRAVATLAGNSFSDRGIVPKSLGGNGLKRRMTHGAARALRGIADFQHLGQPLRSRGFKRCIGSRMMKIVRGPNRVLIALFPCAAVATARTARLRAQKFRRGNDVCALRENCCRKN